MDEKSTIALNPRQQLLDFMLEMPEIYGYEQDHLTHAERKAQAEAPQEDEE